MLITTHAESLFLIKMQHDRNLMAGIGHIGVIGFLFFVSCVAYIIYTWRDVANKQDSKINKKKTRWDLNY